MLPLASRYRPESLFKTIFQPAGKMKLHFFLSFLIAAAISVANPVEKRTAVSVSFEPASWQQTAIDNVSELN